MAVQYATGPTRGAAVRRRSQRGRRLGAVVGATMAAMTAFAGTAHAQTVGLGTADSFGVLAGSTVTNTGPTLVTGDLGVSPGTAVVGAPQVVDGSIHANDAVAQQAKIDLVTAYDDAAARPSTGAVAADLAGLTLTSGVYTAATSLGLSGDLTLDGQGDPRSVFIFQAGSTLTTAAGSRVQLIGGAQACNVFWQVGSSATIGSGTAFTGNILALTSISLTTGATVDGRVLARNGAVTLDTNTVTRSTCAATPTLPTGTPTTTSPLSTTPGTTAGTATGTGVAATTPAGTSRTTPGATTPGAAARTTRAAAARAARIAARRPGTARLVPGPPSGPLAGPPQAGRCASTPFTIRVTGRNIRQVRFSSGGRQLGTVKAKSGRTVFAMRVDADRPSARVTARVSFTAASGTRTRNLRLSYARCQSVQPRFTG